MSREYKTLKHNVPPGAKLLFDDDLSNRIKLLQASNKLARLISHQIIVSNTRFTISILAETKTTPFQKTSRASREEFLQKLPLRRSQNRGRETNRNFSTGIKNTGKRHTHEIKKYNKDIYK